MRLRFLVLVAATVLAANVNSVEAVDDFQSNVAGGRNLRKHPSATEEERANGNLVMERLASWAASKVTWTNDQLEQLVKKGTSVDEAYSSVFKLDDGLSKLLTNKNFKNWEAFVALLDKNDPEKLLAIRTLVAKYGDELVAKTLYDARQSWRTKKIADDLQAAQIKMWIQDRVDPVILRDRLQLSTKNWDINPYESLWWEYVSEHAAAVSKGIIRQ
ncbi:unnamed protein product [Phytophthora fragariaefolia]|uniref:RxLR effector protein n=1 Tax=Phytophthora fragariaefolia TaxID=1490495 RepID=A0A9W6TWW8_9STRA|nr:unnamed protein product [Phytophthora fragariaefolia]